MHEKLVKQLRNTEHCSGCPYDKDCNEFDSCLMDLLAADAIEDMSKRIARQEKELQVTNGIWGKFEGKVIGVCSNCANAKEDFKESRKGWLNCPMWGAAGINPFGFCHMWKQKES